MIEDDTGFVLHARAYRETSLQLELLTRDHGIVALVAKGVTGAKNHILRAQLMGMAHRIKYLDEALRRIVRQVAMEEIGKKPEVTVVVSRLMSE